MLSKLAAVILGVGVIACVLLTMRQQRLQAVHDLAVVQRRVAEQDRTLWQLRLEIARKVTPQGIERLAQALGPLETMPIADPRAALKEVKVAAADPARSLAEPRSARR